MRPLVLDLLLTVGACAMLVAGLASGAQSLFGLGAGVPWRALLAFAAGCALLAVLAGRHLRTATFGAANRVTLVRGALTALLLGLLGEQPSAVLAWLVVAASLLALALDGVDGWLARRTNNAGAFGARFDMEVDALLIVTMAMLAWQFGKAGAWIVLGGLLRYVFLAAGLLLPWMRRPLPPSRRRQTVCVLQTLSLVVCLSPLVASPLSDAIGFAGLLALCWSFAIDVAWLARAGRTGAEPAVP